MLAGAAAAAGLCWALGVGIKCSQCQGRKARICHEWFRMTNTGLELLWWHRKPVASCREDLGNSCLRISNSLCKHQSLALRVLVPSNYTNIKQPHDKWLVRKAYRLDGFNIFNSLKYGWVWVCFFLRLSKMHIYFGPPERAVLDYRWQCTWAHTVLLTSRLWIGQTQ